MYNARFFATLAIAVTAVAANATITITPGPGNFPNDENVLFNLPGLIATGLLVQGDTNQTHTIVDFFGAGENLTTPPGGQARVQATDGDLTDLTIKLHQPGATFGTLIWNINAAADGNVTFTVVRTGGSNVVQSYALDQHGQNFFRFEATGESMVSVSLHSTAQLQDVRQNRLGSIQNPVPEPASMAALLMGAVALLARRKRTS